jgi:hypothetical protein
LPTRDRPVQPHDQLPNTIAELLGRNATRRAERRAVWREEASRAQSFHMSHERVTAAAAARSTVDEDGLEL